MLRPTPEDPWGVEQHHWNTGAKENQRLNPQWAKQQTKTLRPQPTKIKTHVALCRGHHRDRRPTHRRAIKEGSKDINRDWVKH